MTGRNRSYLVFHYSLADSRGAFTNVFAETAHATAERSAGMKRPPMFHVPAKTAATVTNAQASLFVLMFDAAMPASAPITTCPAATATSNPGISWRKGMGVGCIERRR